MPEDLILIRSVDDPEIGDSTYLFIDSLLFICLPTLFHMFFKTGEVWYIFDEAAEDLFNIEEQESFEIHGSNFTGQPEDFTDAFFMSLKRIKNIHDDASIELENGETIARRRLFARQAHTE